MMFAVARSQSRPMAAQIASLIALIGLPMGVVAGSLPPPPLPPAEHNNFKVLQAEEGSTTCEYSAAFVDHDDFMVAAAKLLGGYRSSKGTITGQTNKFTVRENKQGLFMAGLSGGGVGGHYRFMFEAREAAEKMQQVISTFQLYMDPNLNCITGIESKKGRSLPLPPPTMTMGDVTFKAVGGEDTCAFSLSPVGSADTETYKSFLTTAGALYGAVEQKFGKVTGDPHQPARSFGPNNKDLWTAKFGGAGVGGSFTFRFGTQEEAEAFKAFLEFFKRYFNPKFDCRVPAERRLEDPNIILA